MTKKDPAILRAERLRAIISMPEYEATIGGWIKEAYESALHYMTEAREVCEFHQAQGAYKAIEALKSQFETVFQAEKLATSKLKTIITKDQTK